MGREIGRALALGYQKKRKKRITVLDGERPGMGLRSRRCCSH